MEFLDKFEEFIAKIIQTIQDIIKLIQGSVDSEGQDA